jgi:copper ion binding protein
MANNELDSLLYAFGVTNELTITGITGMTCGKCVGRVERAICAVPGVESAKVDLASAEARVQGSASRDAIVHAVVQAGYGVEEVLGVMPSSSGVTNELTITGITGMTCGKCVGRVERAICAVPGVESAKVDLASAEARVQGSASRDAIVHAVVQAGYGVEEPFEAYSGESRHDGVVMDVESYDNDDELALPLADRAKLKAKLRQGMQKGLSKVATLKELARPQSDCCGGRCERP